MYLILNVEKTFCGNPVFYKHTVRSRPSFGQSGNNRPSTGISNSNHQVICQGVGCPSNNNNGQLGSHRPSSVQTGSHRPSGGTGGSGTAVSGAFANQQFNGPVGEINQCTNKNKCFSNNGGSSSGTNTNRPRPVTGGQQRPSTGQSGNNRPSVGQQLTGTQYVYKAKDFQKKSFQQPTAYDNVFHF